MCKLCDRIYNNLDEYKNTYEFHWDEEIAIIKYKDNSTNLYVPCDDYYYSRMVMEISYCPECGRKL